MTQQNAPELKFGIDLASGKDRTGYFCSKCGVLETPCKHFASAQTREAMTDVQRAQFDWEYSENAREKWGKGVRVVRLIDAQAAYAAGAAAARAEVEKILDNADSGRELHGMLRAWITRTRAIRAREQRSGR